MAPKRHTSQEIAQKLREAEAEVAAGSTVREVCQKLAISQQTYYRWRSRSAGARARSAERIKDLELENARLKRLVADQALRIQVLNDTIELLNGGTDPPAD